MSTQTLRFALIAFHVLSSAEGKSPSVRERGPLVRDNEHYLNDQPLSLSQDLHAQGDPSGSTADIEPDADVGMESENELEEKFSGVVFDHEVRSSSTEERPDSTDGISSASLIGSLTNTTNYDKLVIPGCYCSAWKPGNVYGDVMTGGLSRLVKVVEAPEWNNLVRLGLICGGKTGEDEMKKLEREAAKQNLSTDGTPGDTSASATSKPSRKRKGGSAAAAATALKSTAAATLGTIPIFGWQNFQTECNIQCKNFFLDTTLYPRPSDAETAILPACADTDPATAYQSGCQSKWHMDPEKENVYIKLGYRHKEGGYLVNKKPEPYNEDEWNTIVLERTKRTQSTIIASFGFASSGKMRQPHSCAEIKAAAEARRLKRSSIATQAAQAAEARLKRSSSGG